MGHRLALHGLNPEIRATYTYPFPGAFGWLGVAAVVVGYDLYAEWNKKPTMSSTYGEWYAGPISGPVVFGATCGLLYHLATEAVRALRSPKG